MIPPSVWRLGMNVLYASGPTLEQSRCITLQQGKVDGTIAPVQRKPRVAEVSLAGARICTKVQWHICLLLPPRVHTMKSNLPNGFLSSLRLRLSQRRNDSRHFQPRLERLEDRSLLSTISGTVSVGGEGFESAHVVLYAADADSATLLGQD